MMKKGNTGAQRTSQSAKTAVEWHKEGGIYFERALKEKQPRHYAKALKYFKEAQKLDPDSPTLWYHVSVTLFCMWGVQNTHEQARLHEVC